MQWMWRGELLKSHWNSLPRMRISDGGSIPGERAYTHRLLLIISAYGIVRGNATIQVRLTHVDGRRGMEDVGQGPQT